MDTVTYVIPEPITTINLTSKRYRTKRINLVLFAGKAGVGKSTAAKYIKNELDEKTQGQLKIEHTGFAYPVKEIARSIFGWDGKKDDRGRRLLQVIGTEAGRAYDENMWVRKLEENQASTLFPNNFVLIDDWRFPNEKSYFKGDFLFEITTIRIERPNNPFLSESGMQHRSENSLPLAEKENLVYNENEYYNFSVFNSDTIEEFYKKLDNISNYLSTKIISY